MKSKNILILSIISSSLVILYQLFQWSIVEMISVFLAPFLWLAVFGFFLLVTVTAVITLFTKKVWKPFIIQMVTILILFFFPFNQVILDMDFKMNKLEREKVVCMVNNGNLSSNVTHNSSLRKLPEEYERLSKGGGEIVVKNFGDDTYILFFTFRGVLDNFSGFVYSPNDNPPVQGEIANFKEVERLDENWFFVSSY